MARKPLNNKVAVSVEKLFDSIAPKLDQGAVEVNIELFLDRGGLSVDPRAGFENFVFNILKKGNLINHCFELNNDIELSIHSAFFQPPARPSHVPALQQINGLKIQNPLHPPK